MSTSGVVIQYIALGCQPLNPQEIHCLAGNLVFSLHHIIQEHNPDVKRDLTHSLTPKRYNPCRVLADSRSRLHPSLSLALLFQFLTPSLSAPLITPSIHLRFGLPTRLQPSGLSKVIFLHGRLSRIRTICPAHLSLVILIVCYQVSLIIQTLQFFINP